MSDKVSTLLEIPGDIKQQLLETLNPQTRLQQVLDILKDDVKVMMEFAELKEISLDEAESELLKYKKIMFNQI